MGGTVYLYLQYIVSNLSSQFMDFHLKIHFVYKTVFLLSLLGGGDKAAAQLRKKNCKFKLKFADISVTILPCTFIQLMCFSNASLFIDVIKLYTHSRVHHLCHQVFHGKKSVETLKKIFQVTNLNVFRILCHRKTQYLKEKAKTARHSWKGHPHA